MQEALFYGFSLSGISPTITRFARSTLTPDVARVQFRSDLVNARRTVTGKPMKQSPPPALASLENKIGERSSSHTIFA